MSLGEGASSSLPLAGSGCACCSCFSSIFVSAEACLSLLITSMDDGLNSCCAISHKITCRQGRKRLWCNVVTVFCVGGASLDQSKGVFAYCNPLSRACPTQSVVVDDESRPGRFTLTTLARKPCQKKARQGGSRARRFGEYSYSVRSCTTALCSACLTRMRCAVFKVTIKLLVLGFFHGPVNFCKI